VFLYLAGLFGEFGVGGRNSPPAESHARTFVGRQRTACPDSSAFAAVSERVTAASLTFLYDDRCEANLVRKHAVNCRIGFFDRFPGGSHLVALSEAAWVGPPLLAGGWWSAQ